MMINCEQAAHICNKAQYKEASFWEIIQLNMHTLICKMCAKYSKKNGKLTKLCKQANLHTLNEDEKQAMKNRLKTED